jgi:ATP-dependent exoDNAse (exonuclease V) beta subunit
MHHLFEQITHFNTIEKAIDHLIDTGLLQPSDKPHYTQKIHAAIRESNVEHWFDGRYHTHREHSIITQVDNDIVQKRPDRVLLAENETLVVDYKFGLPHPSHRQQVQQYITLLQAMHYPNIQGFLWYVEQRQVEQIQ